MVKATSRSGGVTTTAPPLEGGPRLATTDEAASLFARVSTCIASLLDLVAHWHCQLRVLC